VFIEKLLRNVRLIATVRKAVDNTLNTTVLFYIFYRSGRPGLLHTASRSYT